MTELKTKQKKKTHLSGNTNSDIHTKEVIKPQQYLSSLDSLLPLLDS